jgi:hypothetical protein
LPVHYRASIEVALTRATETPADQATVARARIDAGDDPDTVIADFNAQKNGRPIGNRNTAKAGYRDALIWVTRAALDRGQTIDSLCDVRDVLTRGSHGSGGGDHVRRAEHCAR